MPEELIFESFDVLEPYEFKDHRIEPLKMIYEEITELSSYSDFQTYNEKLKTDFNFQFFQSADQSSSQSFEKATREGNINIKESLLEIKNKVSPNGKEYTLSTKKELAHFFQQETDLNEAFTRWGIAGSLMNWPGMNLDFNEEKIYNSYNGQMDTYIKGFTLYSSDKIITMGNTARNDGADLFHLLYIKKGDLIVSDDKIFKALLPSQTVEANRKESSHN